MKYYRVKNKEKNSLIWRSRNIKEINYNSPVLEGEKNRQRIRKIIRKEEKSLAKGYYHFTSLFQIYY